MRIIFFFCLIELVQLYLVEQLRLRLAEWISNERLQKAVFVSFACLSLGSGWPLLWRHFPALSTTLSHGPVPDTLFVLAGIWWTGSAGSALVVLALNAFGRLAR